MRVYTTAALVENIKRRGSIPADQSTMGTDQMLGIADDELQTIIVPMIMSLRADHFLVSFDYTTTTETDYEIPADALNRNLRNLVYVDSAGLETALTKIEFDEQTLVSAAGRIHENGAYHIRGDVVRLHPTSPGGRTLRMHYYRLPNQLVPVDEAAQVTGVDYGTNVVTTDGIPSAWATGVSVCCVAGSPGFRLRFAAQDAANVSSPTITLVDAADVVIGDWIALEGDSPIPQIPVEAHPILAQYAVAKILEALGDPRMKVSQDKAKEIMQKYIEVATPRVEEAPRSVAGRQSLRHFLR